MKQGEEGGEVEVGAGALFTRSLVPGWIVTVHSEMFRGIKYLLNTKHGPETWGEITRTLLDFIES